MYFLNSEDTKLLTYVGVLLGEGVWMVFVGFYLKSKLFFFYIYIISLGTQYKHSRNNLDQPNLSCSMLGKTFHNVFHLSKLLISDAFSWS